MEANTHRICEMCGKYFVGKPMQIYCSEECYQESNHRYESYSLIRRKKYNKILAYVHKHDMHTLLAKYRPAPTKNKKSKTQVA